ncbi:MAG: hypothetical protein KBF88_04125 [Polyangiaceae bacterium]|nr:hypothetical protein [Polyangiaceae bacterium]
MKKLQVGAILVAVGIATCATVHREIGGVLLVLGWGTLGWAIHSFGREGRRKT